MSVQVTVYVLVFTATESRCFTFTLLRTLHDQPGMKSLDWCVVRVISYLPPSSGHIRYRKHFSNCWWIIDSSYFYSGFCMTSCQWQTGPVLIVDLRRLKCWLWFSVCSWRLCAHTCWIDWLSPNQCLHSLFVSPALWSSTFASWGWVTLGLWVTQRVKSFSRPVVRSLSVQAVLDVSSSAEFEHESDGPEVMAFYSPRLSSIVEISNCTYLQEEMTSWPSRYHFLECPQKFACILSGFSVEGDS